MVPRQPPVGTGLGWRRPPTLRVPVGRRPAQRRPGAAGRLKTAGALAVVPVEAIPVRPVARAVWRAAAAAGLATADVRLTVDDAGGAASGAVRASRGAATG